MSCKIVLRLFSLVYREKSCFITQFLTDAALVVFGTGKKQEVKLISPMLVR